MRENIQYCETNDFEEIFPLLKQLYPKNNFKKESLQNLYSSAVNSSKHILICYKYKGKNIVGFCSMMIRDNLIHKGEIAQIEELIVDEAYRHKGIGKKLITEIILIARFKGCKRIELDSAFHKKKAHTFYEDLGFENRAYIFSKNL